MGSQQFYQMPQQAASGLMGAPAWPQASVGAPMDYGSMGAGGLDPALQAQLAQSLAYPNAGDSFMPQGGMAPAPMSMSDIFPASPGDMAIGAGIGIGAGAGLTLLSRNGFFEKAARVVDNLPGVRQVSGALESRLAKVQRPGLREWLLRDAIDKGAPAAVANAEKRQLSIMAKGFAAKHPNVQKILANGKSFDEVKTALSRQIAALESKGRAISSAEYRSLKAHRGAFQAVHGKQTFSYALLGQQATQTARLAGQGVGPIGRSVAHMAMYTERVFGGGTLRSMMGGLGGAVDNKLFSLGRVLPAALGGAFIFGTAISKARKAEEGEKTSTFMREFLGIGLGSFIGWEIGQKFLTAVGFRGFMDKVGSKLGISHLASRLMTPGRGLLEKVFGPKAFSSGILRFLPKLSFGGFTVGILGMFVFGTIFQKIFERVSDSIFGKPSEASLNGGAQAAGSGGFDPTSLDPASMAAMAAAMGGQMNEPSAFSGFQQPTAGLTALPSMNAMSSSGFSLTPDQIRQSAAAAQTAQALQAVQLSQQQLGY